MALLPSISTREGYASVSTQVEAVSTSTREGYASVGELIGYESVFFDRTGYASVSEFVGVGATSTREGYASVSELIGYDSMFHERTDFASVSMAVTIPLPVVIEVRQPTRGWGPVVTSGETTEVSRDGHAGGLTVSEHVGAGPNAVGERDGFTSVFEGNVVAPQ